MADHAEFSLKVIEDKLTPFVRQLDAATHVGIDKILARVEQDAGTAAPTDTGALRASRFRITPLHDDFNTAVSSMEARNPRAGQVEKPQTRTGDLVVGFAAPYALPVHDGHHTRNGGWVPGRPFLLEAFQAHINELDNSVSEAMDQTVKTGHAPHGGGE